MTEAEIIRALTDQSWRLNNLYSVIDKEGKLVPFRMNWAQEQLFNEMWYLNIVLKARQLGMSTFIAIYLLDVALFYENTSCGIIAQTLDDAANLFSSKILFAYNGLPDGLKAALPKPVRLNTTELELSNGSSIRVGTSLRGSTLQYLHISEFGKIAAKFPDRAREIVTGALNTLSPGSVAFIESTAEGNEGRFHDLCQRARSIMDRGDKLSKLDWKFHFYPWYREPKYTLDADGVLIPPSLGKYFAALASDHGVELSPEQKAWYTKKYEDQQQDMSREFPATPDEAFAAAIEGAYYGELISRAEKEGRIAKVPYEPLLPVETAWDIGMNDSTCIWFFQREKGGAIRFFDYYESSGEGLGHYASVLRKKDYRYEQHILPHDIRVKEMGTGVSRFETLESMGIKPINIAPQLHINDGIEAVRNVLGKCYFDAEACADGLKALRNYRKEWDDKGGTWKNRPLHDWSSHASDSFRYFAVTPAAVGGDFDTPTNQLNLPKFGAV